MIRKAHFCWLFEQQERWLERLSLEGLELVGISPLGFFEFKRGVPAKKSCFLGTEPKWTVEATEEAAAAIGWHFAKRRGMASLGDSIGVLAYAGAGEKADIEPRLRGRFAALRFEYKWRAIISGIWTALAFVNLLSAAHSGQLAPTLLWAFIEIVWIADFCRCVCNLRLIGKRLYCED